MICYREDSMAIENTAIRKQVGSQYGYSLFTQIVCPKTGSCSVALDDLELIEIHLLLLPQSRD